MLDLKVDEWRTRTILKILEFLDTTKTSEF